MNILDEIVANKRQELETLKTDKSLDTLKSAATATNHSRKPFRGLFDENELVVIAEIKPKSPSAGTLIERSPLDVADLYANSDADVISVLTDKTYFGGDLELLNAVRPRVPQTILRKDFIIDEYQVYETALSRADTFLLIAAILSTDELKRLRELGESLGLEALVEVHVESDVEKAVASGASVIGINNRDLTIMQTDLATTERLSSLIPKEIPFVSESGIETPEDVQRVRKAGARGILVGTSILRAPEPAAKIAELKHA